MVIMPEAVTSATVEDPRADFSAATEPKSIR